MLVLQKKALTVSTGMLQNLIITFFHQKNTQSLKEDTTFVEILVGKGRNLGVLLLMLILSLITVLFQAVINPRLVSLFPSRVPIPCSQKVGIAREIMGFLVVYSAGECLL